MNQRARKPIRSPLVKKDRDRPVVQQPEPKAPRSLTSLIPNRSPAAGRPPAGESPAVKDGPSFGAWLSGIGAAGLQNPRNAKDFKRYVTSLYLSKLKESLSGLSQQIQSDIQDPQMARLVMKAIVDTVAGGVGAIAKGEVPDPAQKAARTDDAVATLLRLGSSEVSSKNVRSAIRYIQDAVKNGLDAKQAARDFRSKYPNAFADIMDYIGSYPSSETELRALQMVASNRNDMKIQETIKELLAAGYKADAVKLAADLLPPVRTAGRRLGATLHRIIHTSTCESNDPTITVPDEVHVYTDGTCVACHADSGDVSYPSLLQLESAYMIDTSRCRESNPAEAPVKSALTASRKVKIPEKEVEYTITCEPADLEIEGNAMASGDDEVDKAAEDAIREQLESGNEWAWCYVKVTAHWKNWTGVDGLGGCSYKNEADFKRDGYYEDMKAQALDNLRANVQHHADEAEELEREEEATEASMKRAAKRCSFILPHTKSRCPYPACDDSDLCLVHKAQASWAPRSRSNNKSAKLTPQQLGIIEDILKGMDHKDPAYQALSEYAKGLKTQGPQKGQSVGIQSLAHARKARIAARTAKGLGIQEGTIQTHLDVMKTLADKGDIQGLARRLKELEADVSRASKGASISEATLKRNARLAASKKCGPRTLCGEGVKLQNAVERAQNVYEDARRTGDDETADLKSTYESARETLREHVKDCKK